MNNSCSSLQMPNRYIAQYPLHVCASAYRHLWRGPICGVELWRSCKFLPVIVRLSSGVRTSGHPCKSRQCTLLKKANKDAYQTTEHRHTTTDEEEMEGGATRIEASQQPHFPHYDRFGGSLASAVGTHTYTSWQRHCSSLSPLFAGGQVGRPWPSKAGMLCPPPAVFTSGSRPLPWGEYVHRAHTTRYFYSGFAQNGLAFSPHPKCPLRTAKPWVHPPMVKIQKMAPSHKGSKMVPTGPGSIHIRSIPVSSRPRKNGENGEMEHGRLPCLA